MTYDPADTDPATLLTRFVTGLRESGIAVFRASLWLPTAHPELWGTQVTWTEAGNVEVARREHGITATPTYLNTPGEIIYQTRTTMRWRLDVPSEQLAYPMLREFKEQGGTDYVMVPFRSAMGEQPWVSLATKAPGGFSDEHFRRIEAVCLHMAWKTRLAIAESATRSLLQVYLGPNAADQVMAGQFRRGRSIAISAVIWFCDLRGFTALGDRLPAAELVATLDRYFELVAAPIEEHGGEVLKFVGDAVLAVFPCEGNPAKAAAGAWSAARKVLGELDRLAPLKMGIALHVGEVLYGNIGGRSRLDFTVIGPAVNEASRVEALCKTLGTPLLATGAFVTALGSREQVRSLGLQALRGVSRQTELFTSAAFTV
ncbi:MAG: adenylate/guanylate cyclase domain-containing protein [Gammaproteobacteria bacterium]